MEKRTDPLDALERISWYLSFQSGEKLSLNQISKSTGLAWATVQKYTKAIELIQKLAPQISVESDGVKVGRKTTPMEAFTSDPAPALAVYLFVQAQQEGSPTSSLNIAEHDEVLKDFLDEIQKMKSLGWIERDEESINLTPLGVQIAGPAHSALKNGEREEEILKVDRRQKRAVIDSSDSTQSAVIQPATKVSPSGFDQAAETRNYSQSEYKRPQYS